MPTTNPDIVISVTDNSQIPAAENNNRRKRTKLPIRLFDWQDQEGNIEHTHLEIAGRFDKQASLQALTYLDQLPDQDRKYVLRNAIEAIPRSTLTSQGGLFIRNSNERIMLLYSNGVLQTSGQLQSREVQERPFFPDGKVRQCITCETTVLLWPADFSKNPNSNKTVTAVAGVEFSSFNPARIYDYLLPDMQAHRRGQQIEFRVRSEINPYMRLEIDYSNG